MEHADERGFVVEMAVTQAERDAADAEVVVVVATVAVTVAGDDASGIGSQSAAVVDECCADDDFEGCGHRLRDVDAQCDKAHAEDENRRSVADTPGGTDIARPLLVDKRRHRGEMVGFQRVRDADGPADCGCGDK